MEELNATSSPTGSPTSSPTSSPTGSPTDSKSSISKILEMIISNPNITIVEIAKSLGISDRAVKKHILKLKENNRIKRIGSNFKGYWQIIDTIPE